MKVTLSEKKRKIYRESRVEGMKLRIKSMIWNIRKKKTTKQNNKKKKRIQKNKDSVSSLWDNFKQSNIHIIGCQKKRKSKKLEIYLKE